MSENQEIKFSDEVIAQIAKAVQIAILSGTDIVDHLRTACFITDDNMLYISPEYKQRFEENIEKMLEEIKESSAHEGK